MRHADDNVICNVEFSPTVITSADAAIVCKSLTVKPYELLITDQI